MDPDTMMEVQTFQGVFAVGVGGGARRFPSALPDTLLFVLSGVFKIFFILQLVELVLAYNFSRCDFRDFAREYTNVISEKLEKYVQESKITQSRPAQHTFCSNQDSGCLNLIVNYTFNRVPGCPSLATEAFAIETRATLIQRCPGYEASQVNNTPKIKKRKREVKSRRCQEKVFDLMALWRHFIRHLK
ncbi:thymic stromal lymphopoietin [Tenrec ecaudatus]|uniref:thymic stromal lymphopoietin n=1 Tax=Tenrec ecaudatus TaxID=94439 RepID=UPI003F5A6951